MGWLDAQCPRGVTNRHKANVRFGWEADIKSDRPRPIDRLQKYAACFAPLRPNYFGPEVVSAVHPYEHKLTDHDILSVVKSFVGLQPKAPNGNIGDDDV